MPMHMSIYVHAQVRRRIETSCHMCSVLEAIAAQRTEELAAIEYFIDLGQANVIAERLSLSYAGAQVESRNGKLKT